MFAVISTSMFMLVTLAQQLGVCLGLHPTLSSPKWKGGRGT